MRLLTALNSGAAVKNVALEFVQVLLKKSWQNDELNLEIACDFVNDILKAIGLDATITPEQINKNWSYVWPIEKIQIYTFHYIEVDFTKLEELLREICALVKIQNDIFIKELSVQDSNLESPVELLTQLVAIWCSVYKQLQKLEELQSNKRFEEPLARINFPILLGMHELRILYRLNFCVLDSVCNRLYWSTVQGLFYRQTHDMVFSGLLNIFSKNYDLFYANDTRTIVFFYEAFACEINASTPLKLYETLKDMLLYNVCVDQKNILLNFLIEPYMLEVYFTTFLAKKFKVYKNISNRKMEKIQQESIKFLNVLQSKLLSLDCFPRKFMEAILNLVFTSDRMTSSLSCNLYITMMKRKFSDQLILKHIMDFYVIHVGSMCHLKTCVQSLVDGFEYLLSFNFLLEIITNNQAKEIIRLLSAHILVLVFEIKTLKTDSTTKKELQHLLQILPEVLENLDCQTSQGILLKVYNFLPIEKLTKPVLDNFIHYAVGIFTYTDRSIDYALLMNIFTIFHKFLTYNKEWYNLELLTGHLFNKYQEMMKSPRKDILKRFIEDKNNLIKRLNILLKLKYDLLDDSYLSFMRYFCDCFLYNAEMEVFISEKKDFTDTYVLEIIISCFLKLCKQRNDDSQTCNPVLETEADKLFMFLWPRIRNTEEFLKFPIVKMKTYFCSFLQVIIHLPSKLNNQIYHQLVQVLIVVNFKKNIATRKGANELQQINPLQSVEYQHLMFRQFTEMHTYQKVQINTNMVWKLCIYYGLFRHNFQADLKNLLITLANHRLNIFKHIISVIIYNLYKQTPMLRQATIVSILKQLKHLIDNDIAIDSKQLLNVHVVLLVLQILAKALSVIPIKAGHNRLEALRHLNIFIENLDLNQLQAKPLLLQQLIEINQNLMDTEENKMLLNFCEMLN